MTTYNPGFSANWFRCLDGAGVALLVVDHGGQCICGTAQAMRILREAGLEATEDFPFAYAPVLKTLDLTHWQEWIDEALAGKRGEVEESLHPTNPERWVRIIFEPCPMHGEGQAVIFFKEDHLLREAEEKVAVLEQRVRRLTENRDRIFSIIGHDLRAPVAQLHAIQYLLEQAPNRLSEANMPAFVKDLNHAIGRLSVSLETLDYWTSSQKDNLTPDLQMVDVMQVCRTMVEELNVEAVRKRIHLVLQENPIITLQTDPIMLAFILRNLITNAVKFTPAGGKVEVGVTVIDTILRLWVQDSGVGMPPNLIQALEAQDPILSHPGTGGERGTGLGLRVCQELALCLGGVLSFSSYPGQGTRVEVVFPTAKA